MDLLEQKEKRMITNDLSHHGILGMKWGVRRYQNPDGSLTNAGRKRYADGYGYGKSVDDDKLYGRGAGKRINNRMLNGDSLTLARHKETFRRADYIRASKKTRSVLSYVGAMGATAIKMYAHNARSDRAIDRKTYKKYKAGASLVASLLPTIGESIVRYAGGYEERGRGKR